MFFSANLVENECKIDVKEMAEMWLRADRIIQSHVRVEKIKRMNNTFMIVSGLDDEENEKHVKYLIEVALDLRKLFSASPLYSWKAGTEFFIKYCSQVACMRTCHSDISDMSRSDTCHLDTFQVFMPDLVQVVSSVRAVSVSIYGAIPSIRVLECVAQVLREGYK